ncbi:hypothetical protein O6H91_22G016000 [Diphasiastrum complanatum]|uniref:Uncharacterized protein n=1 Tax=Diphasiastrum complanatum TaxID=34168 RepID=A0ACC2ADB1_DIPCM|nr:hypothetical protein O6H91_22G016000 [Diphasiastrum complanatum]
MQADEAKAVAVQDTVLVTPTDVKESFVHSLSNLDQLNAFIPCYFPILYFFRSGAETPAAATKLVPSLKQALAEALDLYPVLAGRLRKGKGGLLEVEVNGKGVEFSVATTEARLDAWEDLRFCSIALQLVPNKPFMFGEMLIGAPPACVQVTTFQCGGVAISLSFLHALGDMQAMAEFVEAWACIHRDPLSPPITPCLDTAALLRSRDPPTVDVPIDGLMQLSGIQHGQNSENKEGEGEGSPNSLLAAMSTVNAVLRMGDAKVAEAVREVESGPYSYGRASSFEVVAGLLWVALTRARDLPPDSSTRFALPVNMRQRWRPPLPPRFFGNAAVPAMAIARSGDLVAPTQQS